MDVSVCCSHCGTRGSGSTCSQCGAPLRLVEDSVARPKPKPPVRPEPKDETVKK
jgi:hypothetical protein